MLMELCDGGCVATLLRTYGALRWNIVSRYRRCNARFVAAIAITIATAITAAYLDYCRHRLGRNHRLIR